jgi:hypothetical protein
VIQNVSEDEAGFMMALASGVGSSGGDVEGSDPLLQNEGTSNNILTSASTIHLLKTSLAEVILSNEENDRKSLLKTFVLTLTDTVLNL